MPSRSRVVCSEVVKNLDRFEERSCPKKESIYINTELDGFALRGKYCKDFRHN